MKKLAVHYCGWGEDWPLSTLADDGRTLQFEYSSEALAHQLERAVTIATESCVQRPMEALPIST